MAAAGHLVECDLGEDHGANLSHAPHLLAVHLVSAGLFGKVRELAVVCLEQ